MSMQGLTGSYIVTGGASGLGEACTKTLAGLGAKVVIADVNEETGRALAESLEGMARFVRVDVTDEAQCQHAVDAAVELAEGEGLRGLVGCAGVAPSMKVVGREGPHDLGVFSKAVGINLVGLFNMLRLCAAAMADNEPDTHGQRGVLINTASIAAQDGQIGQCAYAASKAGVIGLTLPAARELARHGIRVMTIAPGIFDTAMMAGFSDEVRDGLAKLVPFPPRLGDPNEFASLVLHIVNNPMLNGETIRLDGALRMNAR
ncbi:MAG: SDR family NAD(P)-dependent oxidoreductase [Phycisphaerales bacterium JB063]